MTTHSDLEQPVVTSITIGATVGGEILSVCQVGPNGPIVRLSSFVEPDGRRYEGEDQVKSPAALAVFGAKAQELLALLHDGEWIGEEWIGKM